MPRLGVMRRLFCRPLVTPVQAEGGSWFTFKEGRYYAALWNRGTAGIGDCLAGLWRDPGGPWHFTFRVRRYVDDKTHGSADPRTDQDLVLADGIDEETALRSCRRALKNPDFPVPGRLNEILLRTDDMDVIFRALSAAPFLHLPPHEGDA